MPPMVLFERSVLTGLDFDNCRIQSFTLDSGEGISQQQHPSTLTSRQSGLDGVECSRRENSVSHPEFTRL
jgi:hypothetical protein